MTNKPALLGGKPVYGNKLPIVNPKLPLYRQIEDDIKDVMKTGMVTKGKYLERFEKKIAQRIGVKNAVCVSNCTTGLILVFQALGIDGEVILPSYTFMASAHILAWNNITPKFVEIHPKTWNVDVDAVERAITPRTVGILAVHNFGNPADIEGLQRLAQKYGIRLIYDAAHGFGSLRKGTPVGSFGDAEVFSMSPTKVLVAGEGGVVTTNNDQLAETVRVGREYGNAGDYNSIFPGLNGRMSEFHAILGYYSLLELEENVRQRNQIAEYIRYRLKELPGFVIQDISQEDRSSFKDLGFIVDEVKFGCDRDHLAQALEAENIDTRKYHYPPVHMNAAYGGNSAEGRLPITEQIAKRSISIPLYSQMEQSQAELICFAIERIHDYAVEIMKGQF